MIVASVDTDGAATNPSDDRALTEEVQAEVVSWLREGDAIGHLDPDLAELVRLVHWERMSISEAAELLGIPASTARGRYQRAKEELRAALSIEVPLA